MHLIKVAPHCVSIDGKKIDLENKIGIRTERYSSRDLVEMRRDSALIAIFDYAKLRGKRINVYQGPWEYENYFELKLKSNERFKIPKSEINYEIPGGIKRRALLFLLDDDESEFLVKLDGRNEEKALSLSEKAKKIFAKDIYVNPFYNIIAGMTTEKME